MNRRSRVGLGALFDVGNFVVEDFPNQRAEPVGHRPNRALVSQSRHQSAEDVLEVGALLFDCRLSGLCPDQPEKIVSLGGAGTVVLLRVLLPSRWPAGLWALRRKCRPGKVSANHGNRLLTRPSQKHISFFIGSDGPQGHGGLLQTNEERSISAMLRRPKCFMVSSNSARRMSRTRSTPACPNAAKPHK